MITLEEIAYTAALQVMLAARDCGYEPIPRQKKFFRGALANLEGEIVSWLKDNMQEEAPCGPSEH